MAESLRKRVVDLLVEKKGVDRNRIEAILKSPQAREKGLGKALIEEGLVTPQGLLETLAQGLKLPLINLARYQIDPSLSGLVPEKMARRYQVVPISKIGNRLSVAMADPLNVLALDDLALLTTMEISPAIAAREEVDRAIEQLYRLAEPLVEGVSESTLPTEESSPLEEQQVVDLSAFGMAGERAPIIRVVDHMIVEALKIRASDIHLEPYENQIRVRYRVDGHLLEAFQLPLRYRNPVLTRLKIMAKLDITENRLPQDGRFKVRMESREIDFRVSVLPVSFGNKVVLRVLDKSALNMNLDQFGFLPDSLAAFEKAIARPYGLILVTGPTGSGKSTTLYSVLNQMNDPGRNILTIEDPVEYQLDGITQVQVNPEIGLTFANSLRAFLRQAPDVVLVGEIRDGETADIVIKASLTGQIVLSTLHTNDASSAVTRLVDMGADPFLLASSLNFVAAQRLCRQLCPKCKLPEEVNPERLKELGLTLPEGKRLYRSHGCPHCRETGFRGRFAILEAMLVDDPIREMIITRQPPDEVKARAVAHGMRTLRQEGWVHCLMGRTSLEEVLEVTSEE